MAYQHIVNVERLCATFVAAGLAPSQAEAALDGRTEGLSRERVLAVVAIDADAIQRTLLASPRPVTISGASASLAEWDQQLRNQSKQLVPTDVSVLFSGGGSALLLAPREQAPDLVRRLEGAFSERMVARATGAFLPISPAELVEGPRVLGGPENLAALGLDAGGGGFGGCVANLAFALRAAKLEARPHPYVAEPTSAARCVETGDRARAQGTLSDFASIHHKRGREERNDDEMRQARTLDDVLKWAKARRLAFICIDGAKIGKLLMSLRSMYEYAELSSRLDQAFRSLLEEEVRFKLGLREKAHQVIFAGGDDLLLVAPAEAGGEDRPDALELTSRLVHSIENAFADTSWEGKVGVGAGVLITSGGVPARFAFDYARALCDSAKSAIDPDKGARSGIDFEVVLAGAPLSSSIPRLRKDRMRQEVSYPKLGVSSTLHDTQRPYSIDRFDRLLDVARALRASEVGQSALGGFTRALQADLNTALIDVYYHLARDTRGAVRAALGVDSLDMDKHNEWILREIQPGAYATGLIDLAEVTKLKRGR